MPKTKVKNSRTTAKKSTARKTTQKLPSLTQSYLDAEQAEFHKQHPQAQKLIAIFLLSFLVLVVAYLYRM